MDGFGLCRRHCYATVLIDAETRERIDVLPGRSADALETCCGSSRRAGLECPGGKGVGLLECAQRLYLALKHGQTLRARART
ncbi:hypothetical protein ACIBI9_57860 [Nonomuraea sp. NPDC050451]|uniref:hypothetical protein n=1 Tax=Nonomuraea sp. NPDC050451 TaxID=3364364 RepID=UPI0037B64C36